MIPSSSPGGGFRLPRARRIARSADIRSLFRRGKRSKTASLDVLDSASPAGFSRVGWVVPLHRHTAVERNRLKRRLREIVRTEVLSRLDERRVAADVLVRARPEAYRAGFADLRDELVKWLDQRWPLDPHSR
ncbi:MAG TPA: ribonuclease P protein component [Longimicrobiales bacterium]|nr:ribonuclease P protein component [Longimicrobiales bacterium]